MTISAAVQAELPYLRAEAEALMLDVGTASRPTGGYTYDPSANGGQGGDVETTSDLFTSPCKIQSRNLVTQAAEVGERTAIVVRTELHLPVSTAPLTTGDLWEVTTPHALSTVPTGQRYRVVGPVGKTLATARRYDVEEVS